MSTTSSTKTAEKKMIQQTAAKPVEKSAEKSVEKSVEKSAEKSAEKKVSKPATKSVEVKKESKPAPKTATKESKDKKATNKTQQKRELKEEKITIEEIFRRNLGAPALKRVARRAGCVRVNSKCFRVLRGCAYKYLTNLLDKTIALKKYAKRQTVTVGDVMLGSKFCRTQIL